MGRNAKAPSAGSTASTGTARARKATFGTACACVVALVALLGGAAPLAGAARACPNEAVRLQQHSTFLPECRAYELVSPPAKNSSVIFEGALSADGTRALVTAAGGLDGGGLKSPTLGVRNPDGSWDTRSLLPPSEQRPYPNYELIAYDDAFTRFFAESSSLLSGAGSPAATVSIDDHANQTIHASFSSKISSAFPNMIGSADLSRVYASVSDPVAAGHVDGTHNLYDVAQDPPLLVSRLPDGSVPTCGIPDGTLTGFAKANLGHTTAQHWVSRDGSRVFFLSSGNGPCDTRPTLYRRDLGTATTTLISGPPLAGGQENTSFLQASADGSAAVFATRTVLTSDDSDETGDVYRWEAPSALTCITCVAASDANVKDSNGLFEQTVAVSQDLSHIYFVSESALVPGTVEGQNNLYVWHLTSASGPAGAVDFIDSNAEAITAINNPVFGAQLTPDGNVFLYTSGVNEPIGIGNQRLNRYDDRDGSLRCLSCPEGGPPTSLANLSSTISPSPTVYTRAMSDDGSRVFFSSGDALIPGADGGGLYEWRDDGSARGEYGLITGNLLDVSADGSAVLILSNAVLTPDVQDTSNQAYVARIGGGRLQPDPPAPSCAGDACQGAPSVAPTEPTAASAAFVGPPSPKAKRHHKAKKDRKHRKHQKQKRAAKRAASHDQRTNR